MLSTLARRFVTPVRVWHVARFHRGEWLHLARPITVLCAGRQCPDGWNGPRGYEVALVGRVCDGTHPHPLLFSFSLPFPFSFLAHSLRHLFFLGTLCALFRVDA